MKTYIQQFNEQYDKLYDLYNACYSDESNDLFDELHDSLLYQIDGFSADLDEDGLITQGSVREITDLVSEVTEYYNKVTSVPQINWIYG